MWRGKFDKSSGTIVLDKDKGTGTVDITVDASSIDFGNPKLDEHAKSAEMFDVAKYPTATYKGTLGGFKNGAPTEVDGTLHAARRDQAPDADASIRSSACTYPMDKKEALRRRCHRHLQSRGLRARFGDKYGFKMDVKLAIQVEAVRA